MPDPRYSTGRTGERFVIAYERDIRSGSVHQMGDMERRHVLVVDDEPSIRELLTEALAHEGLTAVAAGDGEEAVRLALARRPDLVVLDMGLPLIDGAGVAARIREVHGDAVPFVIVTAGERIDEAAKGVRAASYIAKPFDLDDLVRAVRSAIEPPPGAVPDGAAPSVA
jgi:two-component system OmpR family response regulator